jgi:hypothetical protein
MIRALAVQDTFALMDQIEGYLNNFEGKQDFGYIEIEDIDFHIADFDKDLLAVHIEHYNLIQVEDSNLYFEPYYQDIEKLQDHPLLV